MDSPVKPPVGTPNLVELTGRKWIRLRKFAELIGKSYPTVLKMVKSDPPKVRAVLVGGTYRVYEDEVRRFLTEGNAKD